MQTVGIQTIGAGRSDLTHLDGLCQMTLPLPSPVLHQASLRYRICLLREVAHLVTIQHTILSCEPDIR